MLLKSASLQRYTWNESQKHGSELCVRLTTTDQQVRLWLCKCQGVS